MAPRSTPGVRAHSPCGPWGESRNPSRHCCLNRWIGLGILLYIFEPSRSGIPRNRFVSCQSRRVHLEMPLIRKEKKYYTTISIRV